VFPQGAAASGGGEVAGLQEALHEAQQETAGLREALAAQTHEQMEQHQQMKEKVERAGVETLAALHEVVQPCD